MRGWRKSTWVLLIYTIIFGWIPVGMFLTGLGATGSTQALDWDVASFFLIYVAIGYAVIFFFRWRGGRRKA